MTAVLHHQTHKLEAQISVQGRGLCPQIIYTQCNGNHNGIAEIRNGNYNGGWRRDIRGGRIHKQHWFSRDFFNSTGTTKVFKIRN